MHMINFVLDDAREKTFRGAGNSFAVEQGRAIADFLKAFNFASQIFYRKTAFEVFMHVDADRLVMWIDPDLLWHVLREISSPLFEPRIFVRRKNNDGFRETDLGCG